jgi:hypothetical protein
MIKSSAFEFASGRIERLPLLEGVTEMLSRRWVFLLFSVVVICSIAASIWHYRSKCHGVDACAAAEAESHERDRPSEPR